MLYQNIKYFTDDEFECPCGCGIRLISQRLVQMLDSVRTVYGAPIVINSGFRCYTHNLTVGGKLHSAHRRGLAVDIRTRNSRERFELLRILYTVGFYRIGIRPEFIHVDIDATKPQDMLWVYDDDN